MVVWRYEVIGDKDVRGVEYVERERVEDMYDQLIYRRVVAVVVKVKRSGGTILIDPVVKGLGEAGYVDPQYYLYLLLTYLPTLPYYSILSALSHYINPTHNK